MRIAQLAARVADGTLAVEVEAVAHAARGGRSGKILLAFAAA